MSQKTSKFLTGFTLAELMTVIAIIVLLMAILVPSLTMIHRVAKESQQKAQLAAIDMALVSFRADYGDYPPSFMYVSPSSPPPQLYCGAQKLAEAVVGWDLLGFHPNSAWRPDGLDASGGDLSYDPINHAETTFRERNGPYLDAETANAFKLSGTDGIYSGVGALAGDTFVLTDVFGVKKIRFGEKTVKAGMPILYYKANTTNKIHRPPLISPEEGIYNFRDNLAVMKLCPHLKGDLKLPVKHPLCDGNGYNSFYDYIIDEKASGAAGVDWPYRPDSYLLISAGYDSLYGTSDDICNF